MDKEGYPITSWLMTTPLYAPIELENDNNAIAGAKALLGWQGTVDCYCPSCGQMATFRGLQHAEFERSARQQTLAAMASAPGVTPVWGFLELRKAALCTRHAGHALIFYFIRRGAQLVKVGQNPSYADLAKGETREFAKVLGAARLRELNSAIGLAAHGVGVGAFVYLRRIFESLVEEAHQAARHESGWDEAAYQKLHRDERLQALAGHLPAFLVENHQLYGILSLHLHELTDEDCLANFELVKEGIFAIAEERLAERKRDERVAAAKQAIARFQPPKQS